MPQPVVGPRQGALEGLETALATGLAFLAPTFFLVLLFSYLYFRFGTLPQVEGIFWGLKPAILAVILAGAAVVGLETYPGLMARHGDRFLAKVFNAEEIAYAHDATDPVPRLAARFAAKEAFVKACTALGARPVEGAGIRMRFEALPRVPVVLAYWPGEEAMPAGAQVLFDASVTAYLPLEDIAGLLDLPLGTVKSRSSRARAASTPPAASIACFSCASSMCRSVNPTCRSNPTHDT